MSSYLNIYLRDKETKKNRLLASYSSSSDIYQAFNENMTIVCPNSEEEEKFTKVELADFGSVISSLKEEVNNMSKRLAETEKYASGNTELIDDILSYKEFIEQTTSAIAEIQFLKGILYDSVHGYTSFDAMYINIS